MENDYGALELGLERILIKGLKEMYPEGNIPFEETFILLKNECIAQEPKLCDGIRWNTLFEKVYGRAHSTITKERLSTK